MIAKQEGDFVDAVPLPGQHLAPKLMARFVEQFAECGAAVSDAPLKRSFAGAQFASDIFDIGLPAGERRLRMILTCSANEL